MTRRRPWMPAACGTRWKAFHGHKDPKAVDVAWPYLGHPDRFVRWAARVAIEFQDPSTWREKALAEASSPEATLNALLALTHVSAQDPAHRKHDTPPPDPALRDRILAALDRTTWDQLDRGHAARPAARLRSCLESLRPSRRVDRKTADRPVRPLLSFARPRAERRALPTARLSSGPRRRRQDGRAPRARSHPGRTDPLRRGPTHCSRRAGRPRCGRRISPGSPSRASSRAATASVVSWRTSGAARSPT